MMNYNIEILSLYVSQSENQLKDVVKRVTWKYQVKDGSYAADLFKDTFFESPNVSKYITYANLDPETIIAWIDRKSVV